MTQAGFKIFRHEGCNSYLIFDRKSLRGALIDPASFLMEDYRDYISEAGVKLDWVLETHTHADHISASHQIRSIYKCGIAQSALTQSKRVTRKLADQEKIQIGTIELQALATPGHTPDSMTYYAPELRAAFTGDTLLIGTTGRTDFPGADAAAQYASLHQVIGRLPSETVVFPGHEYNDRLFSTIGTEAVKNPHWLISSAQEFVEMKNAELVSVVGGDILKTIQQNLAETPEPEAFSSSSPGTACGAPIADTVDFASISVEKLSHKLERKEALHAYVDVREPDEFQAGYMPGTQNIPLSELGFHLDELRKVSRVYLTCNSGRRSSNAAKTLMYVDLKDVVNVVGGFSAWKQMGLPIQR